MNINISLFSHFHVDPNMYDVHFSVEDNRRCFEECGYYFNTITINGDSRLTQSDSFLTEKIDILQGKRVKKGLENSNFWVNR